MRTLADWLALQQGVHARSIDLGLERVRQVAQRLGLLQPAHATLIVGGTNGKGSTVAHIEALAAAAGLRCGVFTSPHLLRYEERIHIAGREATAAELVAAFERIEAARGAVTLTFFEYNALAAFELFAAAGLDLAVLEVGLGGRLDATNLIDADVAVLCSVGLDHMDWLGDTVEQIGAEKAGIFRAGRPVVLGSGEMPRSVHDAIAALGADARWPGRDFRVQRDAGPSADSRWTFRGRRWEFRDLPPSALPGEIQYANAAAALASLEALAERRLPQLARQLDASEVARALQGLRLPGRFQILAGEPEWILDVAHNPPAAAVFAAALAARPCAGRTIAVCGMLADKDVAAVAAALAAQIDAWVLCSLHESRGLTADALRQRLPAQCDVIAQSESVAEACAIARARARPADRIIVFGSFHTVGPALAALDGREALGVAGR
jgi:dihydrofolate synthase/folylpolyglutamate synthase